MSQETEIVALNGSRDSAPAREIALDLGRLLEEHKGGKVVVLDLRDMNAWTDFFVIATATSGAHREGLERHIKEFAAQREIEIFRQSPKLAAEEDWRIVDLGTIVIHIMSEKARNFYELERLWSAARVIFPSDRH
ncbi:MAG: ribosome silencing factor [Treponema sp.]|jgi:ribosome-associated protein|nr:ribosome silencing factor [Treponema sp.]